MLAADSLCPVDGARSVTVVLLDASDDIPEIGRREVATYLQDIAEAMPEYGLLELRLLDPTVPGGREVFSKCNPGDGSNLNELVANPAAARKRWTAQFRQPLSEALQGGLAPAAADTSPIMEAIQHIAVNRFTGQAAESIDKRLIVVSDMIQHGSAYSQYRDGVSFARYNSSNAKTALSTDLNGAGVQIFYVQRMGPNIQTSDHIEFWMDWVEANGGRFLGARKLQGAG